MNSYTILNARIVADPKTLTLANKAYTELRLADNPVKRKDKNGKEIPSRFVTAKFWEFQAGLAARLSKGDIISITGELGVEQYEDKKTGATVSKDIVTNCRFAVLVSKSFFEADPPAVQEAEQTEQQTDDLPF